MQRETTMRTSVRESQIVSISSAGAMKVACNSGCVWLTVSGSQADLMLRTGEKTELTHCEGLVIQGVKSAELLISFCN